MRVLDIIKRPLQILFDNTATVFYSKNNKRSSGTKHMNIKHRLVREKVNTHLMPRPILLTRHGESKDNVRGRIGEDNPLRKK
nr:6-phosphofructo-2-kinase/fructose-2,6-bisphosphatase-like isoform X2 [Malus domestica]